jgi:hypothetical protein
MRRFLLVLSTAALAAALSLPAQAGQSGAHFNYVNVTVSGNTITVEGREAGLGNVDRVFITLSATAECINNGGNHPKAANKTGVAAGGYFPVQNGHADFSLTGTATFQPDCSRSMTIQFSNIVVRDTTTGLTYQA